MEHVVQLVERRTRRVRLPRADVDFLLTHARHLVEVVPAFKRGVYRVTPRGYVGGFHSPTRHFQINPKIPWPNVRMLLRLTHADHAAASEAESEASLLDVFAREFASQLRAVTHIGLVAGYRECDTVATFLRGKLRVNDQIRDVAARAFPDRFHITESVLDLDTPWNRIPRAIGEQLLGCRGLSESTRTELADAVLSLECVPPTAIAEADFAAAEVEPRAAHYRSLLELCRVIHNGFASASLPQAASGAFLVDLGRAFETWLTHGLAAEFTGPKWSLEEQPEFPLGPTVLQPDIVLRRRGSAVVVLDAKWKAPGNVPDANDLHQVLAYAAITGATHVGLVYPGRRFARRTFVVPASDIAVSLLRVRVIGTTAECQESLRTLARFARRTRRNGKI